MKMLVDVKTGKVGCVILQAIAGCAESNSFLEMTFDTCDWLTSPTENLRVVEGTKEQWQALAQSLRRKRG